MANAKIVRDESKKVKDVCIDFRTREDEALAQRLQDEEFETHYIRNRQERGTARVDVKTAKETYLEEVKRAGLLKEVEYQRLAQDDAWLAVELQQRLDEEEKFEAQQRAAGEIQDQEYALFLEEKEKERLEKARHRRLQNRIDKERNEYEKIERESYAGSSTPDNRKKSIREYGEPHAGMREEKRGNDISHDINGLRVSMSNNNAEERNDACNFNDDGTEYRNIEQELKDEELARELQRKEEERVQRAMEERDRRLALKMQRKEADQYRRERAERQMRRAASMPVQQDKIEDSNHSSRRDEENVKKTQSINHEAELGQRNQQQEPYSSQKTDKTPRKALKEQQRSYSVVVTPTREQLLEDNQRRPRTTSLVNGGKTERLQNEAIRELPDEHAEQRIEEFPPDSSVQEISNQNSSAREKPYMNVAACIDPTYKDEAEEVPHWTERRWGLDDAVLQDPSKPAPVIQNTKRKKSSVKKTKDKNEKCKQQ